METVEASTLARRIRDALMARILNGELAPGERLKDSEIAARYGTSHTPVREALRLLARDGVVEILPYRGCVVRRIDEQEMADIFEVRTLLLGYAARRAAARLTAGQLQQLEALATEHEQALAAGELERAAEAGRRFHEVLLEAVGNGFLTRLSRHLGTRVRLARRAYLRSAPLDAASCHDIVEALRTRDGARAEALISAHIASSGDHVRQALRAQGMRDA
ncbi:MAG TPA: GntR family transcriptional regulator [Anaerolineae bacterium]|nr:GntR family transcriptional regulator [Anaerolineae bacterium]HPL28498.1 GntR family transcriptional regulator [Anaerolineae bacterium]